MNQLLSEAGAAFRNRPFPFSYGSCAVDFPAPPRPGERTIHGEAGESSVEYPARQIRKAADPIGAVPMVSFTDRAATPSHVLVRYLDKESVLLNLETEQYFGLDETGTRMWQLLTASPCIDSAYQELLAEFDVEPELLRANLTDLLSKLVESGLLQVLPADVGTAPAI
jgi:hypothetical protein